MNNFKGLSLGLPLACHKLFLTAAHPIAIAQDHKRFLVAERN